MRLVDYSRVGKNRDPPDGGSPPAVPGAACTAKHLMVFLFRKFSLAQKAIAYTDVLAKVF